MLRVVRLASGAGAGVVTPEDACGPNEKPDREASGDVGTPGSPAAEDVLLAVPVIPPPSPAVRVGWVVDEGEAASTAAGLAEGVNENFAAEET